MAESQKERPCRFSAEFLEEASTYCFEEFGHTWDAAERNLVIFHGHLVALDFGDPEADYY